MRKIPKGYELAILDGEIRPIPKNYRGIVFYDNALVPIKTYTRTKKRKNGMVVFTQIQNGQGILICGK